MVTKVEGLSILYGTMRSRGRVGGKTEGKDSDSRGGKGDPCHCWRGQDNFGTMKTKKRCAIIHLKLSFE